ncbi:hypothetical protein, unlikely [Trypanosoma brucei gambiense DAL972]|uniref:Uncharacterized protein n=1 Tax=Trypanosoma brucei gambiense (strain MHOM/CI/86/DAL972) TaxID=679716 RepID=D0A4H0_TRYB9|nr:hypothetical protein, unlikely [Trypanosoma brucei gambiense DAL972]CBH16164.1 hypothetical protein, unlikely [Trypanosoma brucei gambiense DAL972]|eukprot:XP_011778428.1 hypothetical protein, unlikely [Trypanosoma brucei gambiense DAL972]
MLRPPLSPSVHATSAPFFSSLIRVSLLGICLVSFFTFFTSRWSPVVCCVIEGHVVVVWNKKFCWLTGFFSVFCCFFLSFFCVFVFMNTIHSCDCLCCFDYW